jgi:small-conductance mechanosensitive channel
MSAPGTDPVTGTDGIREAVARNSETAGSIVETLDALALQAGSFRVSLWDLLVSGLVIAGVVIVAWFASRAARGALSRATRLDEAQRLLFSKLISLGVWLLAILIGVDVLGIDLTALTVFSGAFGLAVGFGLQKTFGNLLAGIILLMDRSIKPGDVIAIADQTGKETFGQIRKIGIRAVSITTRDQREYLIPNENLMTNMVENWSYSSRNVRVQVEVGIAYGSDIALAERLMLEAAKSANRVLETPPPAVWLKGFGDSSVDFTIHCWIADPEQGVGNVRSDVLKTLWRLFKENAIEIPFPQRDVNLRMNAELRELLAGMKGGAQGSD